MKAPAAVWERAVPAPAAEALGATGLPPLLCALLARRGVEHGAAAEAFLTPALDQLHSPRLLLGLDLALARLIRARAEGERVAVVGDYDVDGVAATALLAAVLRTAGVEVETLLPRRDVEGYGFQPVHVERAVAAGCALIVTVDCGVQSFAGAEAARARGVDLIVTDHHLPGERMPAGAIVLNPRQPGCSYPFRDLTGAGLALKLGVALLEQLGRPVPWEALLRVACLGTIADVAPLTGENRVIAALGLAALARSRAPGLRALLVAAGVQPPLRAVDVGFRLGPRLNAAGRLESPEPALELLLTRDPARARELVARLEKLNSERQTLESRILDEARAELERRGALPAIVVAWHASWHRGVVGIAAGRLARELHRPVVLFAAAGEIAVGSGRSIAGLPLHDFLAPWSEQLERFGGHDLAVGLTARVDRLTGLREAWETAARDWPPERLVPRLVYDLELDPSEVGTALLGLLERLEPFGPGNPEPLFRFGPLTMVGVPRRFGNRHLALRAAPPGGDPEIEIVGWGWGERPVAWSRPFEILAHLDRDRMRGEAVLRLVDLKPFAAAPAP